jgi:hypothetical protein
MTDGGVSVGVVVLLFFLKKNFPTSFPVKGARS